MNCILNITLFTMLPSIQIIYPPWPHMYIVHLKDYKHELLHAYTTFIPAKHVNENTSWLVKKLYKYLLINFHRFSKAP